MGLIVDTSLFIEAERDSKRLAVLTPQSLLSKTGESEFGISAITLSEIVFGHVLAGSRTSDEEKQSFLYRVRDLFPVYSVDEPIALRTGSLNAHLRKNGTPVGLADVLIAATALELGFGVLTHNLRHFDYIPNLYVVDAREL